MTIGEKIKELREGKHWTEKQLARKSGIKEKCIISYESGEVSPSNATIRKLAKAFRVNLNVLMAAKCLPLISAEELCTEELRENDNITDSEQMYLPIISESETKNENVKPYNVANAFAKWLTMLREIDRLSVQELANAVGLNWKDISDFEIGLKIPDISAFSKLSDYFGVSADVLLGKSELSESDRRFTEFVYRIETLEQLCINGSLPYDLYEICRKSVVDEFVEVDYGNCKN